MGEMFGFCNLQNRMMSMSQSNRSRLEASEIWFNLFHQPLVHADPPAIAQYCVLGIIAEDYYCARKASISVKT